MVITLDLSTEPRQRLREARDRRDRAVMREVLHEGVEALLAKGLEALPQPTLAEREATLDQIAEEMADAPALPDEAVSRAGIYRGKP